jgi:hypothetical protein
MTKSPAARVKKSMAPPPPLLEGGAVTVTCAEAVWVLTASDVAVTVTISCADTVAGGV